MSPEACKTGRVPGASANALRRLSVRPRAQGLCVLGLVIAWGHAAQSSAAWAGPAEDHLFSEANLAYTAGRYEEARDRYEEVVRAGILDERLYYNLGNTYLRLEQRGRAIWAYEKALRIRPGLSDAQHNLAIARERAQEKVRDKVVGAQPPGFWTRTLLRFTVPGATFWFLLFWYLSFGLLFVALVLRPRVWRSLGIALAVLFFVVASFFATVHRGRVHLAEKMREAVVLDDTVPVREGPRGIATKSFDIHAGLRVEITAREDRWWKIRLPNGLEGWVRQDQVGEL